MNLKQLLHRFTTELVEIYERQESISIFNLTVHHISGFNRGQLMLNGEKELDHEVELSYLLVLKQLKTGKPIQYIIGETEFYGLSFKVNPSVLIPRPETEELVDWVIESVLSRQLLQPKIIDIGTGSGCIPVSLKNKLINAEVFALDISEEAVQIATLNAIVNEVDINFIISDILSYNSTEKFDIIVSNPPYITMQEMGGMHRNVLDNEPHLALFVPDDKPLIFYEAIAEFAKGNLQGDGLLFFEINEHLAKETMQMLSDKLFVNIELKKDMQGKDRMLRCAAG